MTAVRLSTLMTPFSKGIVAAVLALGAGASYGELKLIDDESLDRIVARAGLTIDIETQVTIGEIEYVDAGSMYWKDISLTGIGGGLVDNLRAKVDATDGTETIPVGFAEVAMYADMGFFDATETDVAWAIAEYADGSGGYGKQFGNGDAVIHVTSVDMGVDINNAPTSAAEQAANLLSYKSAVDLHYQEGEFGIRSTDGLMETTISSNFSVQAYLGYLDIILKNNGNGLRDTSSAGEPSNIKIADSYIGLDLKFRVDDLDIDNTQNATNTFVPRAVTNPGLTLRDMRIHNERGYDTLGSFGFASIESKIAAASHIMPLINNMDPSLGASQLVDGQAVYDINVKWDWDLPHISFGDTGQSIGKVYFTDFQIHDTSIVFSAH